MTLVKLHLILASFWFGLLAAETVLELSAGDTVSRRTIARVHRWIDLLFEGPVAVAMLVTGGLLIARIWPAPPWVLVHAGLGVIPLVVNLVCMQWVLARAGEADNERERALTRKVKLTGLAIPLAAAAMAVGLGVLPSR